MTRNQWLGLGIIILFWAAMASLYFWVTGANHDTKTVVGWVFIGVAIPLVAWHELTIEDSSWRDRPDE